MATSLLMRAWRTVLGDESVTLSAVTSAAAAGLRSFVGDRPVAVVPHVVSEEFFSRSAVYRAPFRLLFVGELVEHRGLRVLGELSALLPPGSFTLDIVGDGPLRELAATLASKSGGTWHRQVADRKRLAAIIASSQLLVSPSIRTKRWEELFGMALLEAMASGVPCIASDHVGPRSLIENGISGVLVPENSPSAIASAVLRFAEDERLWQSMSRAAKARAEAFRLPYVTSRWAEILGVAEPADTQ
jgi:glycosyltransferase involved in cell wall biosynthesis